MKDIRILIIAFIIVYLIYLIFVVFNKKGIVKIKNGVEAKFLEKVYKIDLKKINNKKFANRIAVNNAIIIAVTFYVTDIFFKEEIFQILLAIPILILLIIFLYSILGRQYKKHE